MLFQLHILTIPTGKNLANSVQELVKIKSWRLLNFLICFHDQLRFHTSAMRVIVIKFYNTRFRVSTAILNSVDIFRRWCKLNFWLLWGHVKSHHFTAILLKGSTRGDNILLCIRISWNSWQGRTLLLPFKRKYIRLGTG